MLGPLNLDKRLSTLLEAAHPPRVVEMDNQQDKMDNLNNVRGPCKGWDDYSAHARKDAKGLTPEPRDYQPPLQTSVNRNNDHAYAYGPPDGVEAFLDDGTKVPPNPYAKRHGGVRPWAPHEVAQTLTSQETTSGYFPNGLLSMVNQHKRFFLAANPGADFKPEEFMGEALAQLQRAITRDQGRRGTEFLKYVRTNIDLVGGGAPGHFNEYRKVRGILSRMSEHTRRAARKVELGDYDPDVLIRSINTREILTADPSISREKNPLGKFVLKWKDYNRNPHPGLEALAGLAEKAVRGGDAADLDALANVIDEVYNVISDEEEIFSGTGMGHGRLGKQPRDEPAIGSPAHRLFPKDYEVYVYRVTENIDFPDGSAKAGESITKQQVKYCNDHELPFIRERQNNIRATNDARAMREARDKYTSKRHAALEQETAIEVVPIEDTNAGFKNIAGTTISKPGSGEEVENPGLSYDPDTPSSHLEDDPEFQEQITHLLHTMRYGGAGTLHGQARRALDIINRLEAIANMASDPKQRPQLEVRPDTRGQGGFEIHDVGANQLIGRTDSEGEARNYINKISDPMRTSMALLKDRLNPKALGDDYYTELQGADSNIARAIETGDVETLEGELEILDELKGIITNDLRGNEGPVIDELSYRIALRKLGLSNYPEKGTVNDPEINDKGELSLWAQAGYPKIQKDVRSEKGKGVSHGTLYDPGDTPGAGTVLTDKHIGIDLNLTPQSVGNKWRKTSKLLTKLAGELIEHLDWSCAIDSFELCVLREARTKLTVVLLSESAPNVRLLYESLIRRQRSHIKMP